MSYIYLCGYIKLERSITLLLILAICIRIISIFSFPHLSEDVYRFWWDGTLLKNGINPFTYTPKEIIDLQLLHGEKLNEYYLKMNSPTYHTVYPVLSQLIYYLSASISNEDIYLFSILNKLCLFFAEIVCFTTFYTFIQKSDKIKIPYLFYLLNPLVIIEGFGNLHFEIMMYLFLLLSIHLLYKNKSIYAGIAISFSILTKLTTLIFLPLFILKDNKINFRILIPSILLLSTMFFLIYPLDQSLEGYKLYFKQFEFNSSAFIALSKILIYFGLPQLWNYRGLILMVIFCIFYLIIIHRFINKIQDQFSFAKLSFYLYAVFLIFNSTLHPWYFIPLIALGLFNFPLTSIYISFIVVFSYSYYDQLWNQYFEVFRIIEYASIFTLFAYEKRTPIFTNRGS